MKGQTFSAEGSKIIQSQLMLNLVSVIQQTFMWTVDGKVKGAKKSNFTHTNS